MAELTPKQIADLQQAEVLMKAVNSALERDCVDVDELTVAADAAGNVAIFGIARSSDAISRATEIANRVPGVKRVINTILPPISNPQSE